MEQVFVTIATLSGAIAVALGAFGAHALQNRLEEGMLATFETGVRYQFYHVLALLAVAFVIGRWPSAALAPLAGWLFLAGTLLFSGSLYLLAITGTRWLGAITPLGGLALIGGWLVLAVTIWRG